MGSSCFALSRRLGSPSSRANWAGAAVAAAFVSGVLGFFCLFWVERHKRTAATGRLITSIRVDPFLAGKDPLPVGVPAVVELALIAVRPLLGHMVRGVGGGGAEV